jgi:hypothetical protein
LATIGFGFDRAFSFACAGAAVTAAHRVSAAKQPSVLFARAFIIDLPSAQSFCSCAGGRAGLDFLLLEVWEVFLKKSFEFDFGF